MLHDITFMKYLMSARNEVILAGTCSGKERENFCSNNLHNICYTRQTHSSIEWYNIGLTAKAAVLHT